MAKGEFKVSADLKIRRWFMPVMLATREAEIRGLMFEASSDKKFLIPHLNQWLGVEVHACYPS
jgi:hypothetical protein